MAEYREYETIVSLDEIIDRNLEDWLDFIAELVGAPLLMDISYGIKELVPGSDGYDIRIWVVGDPSMLEDEEQE